MPDDLTHRQAQVARYVAIGFSDKRIAEALGIHKETVGYHVGQIVKAWKLDPSLNIRVQITHRYLNAAA
jgi:DNA-binding NarL/FixJ family response regulator